MHCFPFLHQVKFGGGCFIQVFLHLATKKMVAGHGRQVVVFDSNVCMGIGLGGLNIGCLTLLMNECSDSMLSYRGGLLSRFNCSCFCNLSQFRIFEFENFLQLFSVVSTVRNEFSDNLKYCLKLIVW